MQRLLECLYIVVSSLAKMVLKAFMGSLDRKIGLWGKSSFKTIIVQPTGIKKTTSHYTRGCVTVSSVIKMLTQLFAEVNMQDLKMKLMGFAKYMQRVKDNGFVFSIRYR